MLLLYHVRENIGRPTERKKKEIKETMGEEKKGKWEKRGEKREGGREDRG